MHVPKVSQADYKETLDFLYNSLPMFQRVGGDAYKKDLSNTVRLCTALGHPEHKFKSVHIAGTNGKGSSSHYLASILQSAGYKTGLYTSPHLKSFTERIRIGGKEIDPAFVVQFVREHRSLIEDVKPSFFEITVVMAFDFFARHQVDIAVVEVGMGGRLDSTNVLLPEVSLITNISFDHQQWLGDTLPAIAGEKAGIIKDHVPVVVSEYQQEVADVFLRTAERHHSTIVFAAEQYRVSRENGNYIVQMPEGRSFTFSDPALAGYQFRNIPGVMAVCDLLGDRGFIIEREHLIHGLENMRGQTGLKGRWQQLSSNPDIFCDVGHNIAGVEFLLKQIAQRSFERLLIVWGMVRDKDVMPVLNILPKDAEYFFCQAGIPRAMPAAELCEKASEAGLRGGFFTDVNSALAAAKDKARKNDLIIIGGSTFVVAELEDL